MVGPVDGVVGLPSGSALPVVDVPSLPHAVMAMAAAMAAAYFVNLWLCIVGSLNDAPHSGARVLQVCDASAPLPNPIARFKYDNALTPPDGAGYGLALA
ncbi:hypothetical protein SAMD00023378_2290 [Ralstonia sp. NT80]|nr:hypothetical protein SAMD00023378_2290 [Ralstonia sp. NT80]